MFCNVFGFLLILGLLNALASFKFISHLPSAIFPQHCVHQIVPHSANFAFEPRHILPWRASKHFGIKGCPTTRWPKSRAHSLGAEEERGRESPRGHLGLTGSEWLSNHIHGQWWDGAGRSRREQRSCRWDKGGHHRPHLGCTTSCTYKAAVTTSGNVLNLLVPDYLTSGSWCFTFVETFGSFNKLLHLCNKEKACFVISPVRTNQDVNRDLILSKLLARERKSI